MSSRHPAVAGSFYPQDPIELDEKIRSLLAGNSHRGQLPKVLIVPHAGYIYSGPIAASAYSLLEQSADKIRKVVLLGPSHRVAFDGLALPSVEVFETPLGDVPLDSSMLSRVRDLEQVNVLDAAHAQEHSLEVHLPFLQVLLSDFTIAPILVGHSEPDDVAEVIDRLWGGDDTLIVISSDLSHYHSYNEAASIDAETSHAIEHFESYITAEQACGCAAINGLLVTAKRRAMKVSVIDIRNSGDTAGSKQKVVGYGAYGLQ